VPEKQPEAVLVERLASKAEGVARASEEGAVRSRGPRSEISDWGSIALNGAQDRNGDNGASGPDLKERYVAYLAAVEQLREEPFWDNTIELYELERQSELLGESLEATPTARPAKNSPEDLAEDIDDLFEIMYRRIERRSLDSPLIATGFVLRELKAVDTKILSAILCVSPATVDAWRQTGVSDTDEAARSDRLVLVGQLVYDLRHTYTSEGIGLWFSRERPQLDGQTPLEVLDNDLELASPVLRSLARGGRGQLAS